MQLPELKMEGRSGCELIVERINDKTQIRKFSNSLNYNSRLIKQAEKQRAFFENSDTSVFTTAKVYETYSSPNELAWFTMPYLFAEKYSNYLDRVTFDQLKIIVEHLINYFNNNFKTAKFEIISAGVINEKIFDVKRNTDKNPIIEKGLFENVFLYLQDELPQEPLPIGTCHGDFTFSNILFGDHEIYLLDFLDSFIESPLVDIVKLRQDTRYKWSIMLEGDMPIYKSNKLHQIFNYLDKQIEYYCESVLKLNNWYTYLQVFNLIRIAPYLTKPNEVTFINNALNNLLR